MTKKYSDIKAKDNMKINKEEEVNQEERETLDKIVDITPTKRKRGLMGRLIHGVAGPEGLPGIGSYVNEEIILPAIKNIVVDAVTSGINMVMYGNGGDNRRGTRGHGGRSPYRPNTNYTSRYSTHQPEPREREPQARSSKMGVEEYIIDDRYDATHVLTALTENADRYGSVSVADYYDLIGMPSQYTDNTYGWFLEDINLAAIIPVRGGYTIKFPPVEVI